MPGFTGDGAWAHSAAYAFMDEISPVPNMEHGTPTLLSNIWKEEQLLGLRVSSLM